MVWNWSILTILSSLFFLSVLVILSIIPLIFLKQLCLKYLYIFSFGLWIQTMLKSTGVWRIAYLLYNQSLFKLQIDILKTPASKNLLSLCVLAAFRVIFCLLRILSPVKWVKLLSFELTNTVRLFSQIKHLLLLKGC